MLEVPSRYFLLALMIVFTISIGEIAIVFILWLENRKKKKARTEKNIV